jgi:hypothetical protein
MPRIIEILSISSAVLMSCAVPSPDDDDDDDRTTTITDHVAKQRIRASETSVRIKVVA